MKLKLKLISDKFEKSIFHKFYAKAVSFQVRPYTQMPPDGNSNAFNVVLALQ